MDIQKQHLCPRLVDYLTIVGARPYTSGKGLAPVQVKYFLILLIVVPHIFFKYSVIRRASSMEVTIKLNDGMDFTNFKMLVMFNSLLTI